MKWLIPVFFISLFLPACNKKHKTLVDPGFADSLVSQQLPSRMFNVSIENLDFWKMRMEKNPDNFVNGPEYAAALLSRFKQIGNVYDLKKADSLYRCSNRANLEKEPALFRTLASIALTQHRFREADSLFQLAIAIDGKNNANAFLAFDIDFERGKYRQSRTLLKRFAETNSFAYLFRASKLEHLDGSLENAIRYMLQAAEKAGNNKTLRQIAISNAADLCLHRGSLVKAVQLYQQSIRIDASDLHSITGLGWIALVRDKNDRLAEKIFNYVRSRSQSPDILLKLIQVAAMRKDLVAEKKYALEFIARASQPEYGAMYSKYLIDLYTGVINEPEKALTIAEKEILNRPTPQVFAWYAWSLYCNQQADKAYEVYRSNVSGQPLEGLELYYMGKFMKGTGKQYNATQFFKAAYKNRYDLAPDKVIEIEKYSG